MSRGFPAGFLEQYHKFYGNSFKVASPDNPSVKLNLSQLADLLRGRLVSLFLPDAQGVRPGHRGCPYASQAHWRSHLWFHEYFHGEDGRGLGAIHQHGWTALVAPLLEQLG
jgi:hypothetical protein